MVFDVIRTVVHPKFVDTSSVILYTHPSAEDLFVPANGGTQEIWCEYRNPTDDYATTLGGTDMVTPVSATDFVANSVADGSGTNLTANVTVVATFFASTAQVILTNNHATLGAYFTTFQLRGKGIYDLHPIQLQAVGATEKRPLTVDLHYQTSAETGQEIADLILTEREVLDRQINRVAFSPHRSSDRLTFAVSTDIGAIISATETQTGLDDVQAFVQNIFIKMAPNKRLRMELGVVPVTVGVGWVIGSAGQSELTDTTILLS